MPPPKLSPDLAEFVLAKSRTGFTLREIVAWLSASHGVTVTPQTVKNTLDRARTAPDRPPPVRPASGAAAASPTPGAEDEGAPAPPEGEEGIAALRAAIEEIGRDLEGARAKGAIQATATLARLHIDALGRLEKLKPPAPPPDVDAEALAVGARAVERLRKLVAAERERLTELPLGGRP